jgi:hypothetical protein
LQPTEKQGRRPWRLDGGGPAVSGHAGGEVGGGQRLEHDRVVADLFEVNEGLEGSSPGLSTIVLAADGEPVSISRRGGRGHHSEVDELSSVHAVLKTADMRPEEDRRRLTSQRSLVAGGAAW